MQFSLRALLVAGVTLAALAASTAHSSAEDAQNAAVKKDRQQIAGTWRAVAVEVDGDKADAEDVKNLIVVNGADGAWTARVGEMEIGQGTSILDPTKTPKTIDFTATSGAAKGNQYLGIYQLGKNTRKLCFASAGKERPTEFSTAPGSQHVLVLFEREQAE